MDRVNLEAKERKETGKKAKALRKAGFIPAVVYGKGITPRTVSVAENLFLKTIGTSAGSNVIINLKVEGETFPVITHDLEKDALSDKLIHIDFLHIRMDEAIKAKVHVELKGTPIGVKDNGGILVQMIREVEIKCLPTNIPEKIEIDVSHLKIGDSIQISDLKGYTNIEFITAANELLAQVSAPTKEEEVAPAVAPEAAAVVPEGQPPAAQAAQSAKAPAEGEKPQKAAPSPKQEAKK